MCKEMNKLLKHMVKYDLGSGILISLLIALSSSFTNAMIYFLGIIVGLLNFICSYYVTTKILFKGGIQSVLAVFITFSRILLVAIIALPLMSNFKLIALYIIGFISHLIMLGISCIRIN